jgi:hypothetical protein
MSGNPAPWSSVTHQAYDSSWGNCLFFWRASCSAFHCRDDSGKPAGRSMALLRSALASGIECGSLGAGHARFCGNSERGHGR